MCGVVKHWDWSLAWVYVNFWPQLYHPFGRHLGHKQFSLVRYDRWCLCGNLRPWWPMQALLQISRIILSAPVFLLGEAVFTAPCMNDGVRELSLPYFRLFWLRFARRLPEKINRALVIHVSFTYYSQRNLRLRYLFWSEDFLIWMSQGFQMRRWSRFLEWCQDRHHHHRRSGGNHRNTFQSGQTAEIRTTDVFTLTPEEEINKTTRNMQTSPTTCKHVKLREKVTMKLCKF